MVVLAPEAGTGAGGAVELSVVARLLIFRGSVAIPAPDDVDVEEAAFRDRVPRGGAEIVDI